jgi:hypothetical protein
MRQSWLKPYCKLSDAVEALRQVELWWLCNDTSKSVSEEAFKSWGVSKVLDEYEKNSGFKLDRGDMQ